MSKPHPQNLVYLLICGAAILVFGLLFILPNATAMSEMDAEIEALQIKIQEQELLNPIYRELIRQAQKKMPGDLPLPQTGKIEQRTLAEINDVFSELARKSGVLFESAVPDASSYMDESGQLTMSVTFSGDFFQFRELLLNVCKLPYLKSMDEFKLVTENAVKRLQLKLRLNQG